MGCASACSGCLVILINLIFLILGLAITAVGGVLKWGSQVITKYLDQFIQSSQFGDKSTSENIQAFVKDIFEYLGNYGLAIFVIGVVLVVLSLFAMCGVCCKSKWMLVTYAIIVGLIAVAIIGFTIVLFVKQNWVRDTGSKELTKFVKREYEGPKDENSLFQGISGVLDLVQASAKCCGVTNSSDYDDVNWNRNITVTREGHNRTISLQIPMSCCKFDKDKKPNATCLKDPTPENSYMSVGCYEKLWGYVDKNWDYVRYGHIGLSAFMVLLVILTICAMRYEKDKVDPI